MVGAYHHGHAVNCGLGNVVNAYAEPAANVSHPAVTVNGRKHSVGVDNKTVGFGHIAFVGVGNTYGRTLECLLDTFDVRIAHNMRRKDEFHPGVLVEVRYYDVLVVLPRAAGNEHLAAGCELLGHRYAARGVANVDNAVETGVARNGDVSYAVGCEQAARTVVLHEEMVEVAEHTCVRFGIRAEENLVGTENARNTVYLRARIPKLIEHVLPEFVFYEESLFGTYHPDETACVARRVKRYVAHNVGVLVVFPYLIARGRKESKQYFVLGMAAAQAFDERASLLELPERGGVKPCDLVVRSDDLGHAAENILASANPQPGLRIERRGHAQPGIHQQNAQIVKQSHRVISEYPRAPCGSVP